MDINKVWVSGLALTEPVLTRLQSKTQFSYFILQTREKFQDRDGRPCVRTNQFRVESLGKAAEATVGKVHQGLRYIVDGYLRQDERDGSDDVRIRTFAVNREETADTALHGEGLRQALDILKKSRDLPTAISTLEELLSAR